MRFIIATPVYNGLPTLPRCVGSVRGQEPWVERRHIIQDGGSTDGSRKWLSQATGLEAVCEKDAGMYDAIQRAWKRGDGDIYSWLNADEQYLPGTLTAVREVFAARPEVDMVFGNALIVGPNGEPLAARREIPLRPWYVKNSFLYALSCTLFFRRRLLDQGRLRFNLAYRAVGDAELILRLLKEGAVVHHLPRYLSLFGVDGKNLSLSDRAQKEWAKIQDQFGAYPFGWMRRLVQSVRMAERAASGCYKTDTLSFAYALDEQPTYRHHRDIRLGFRFTYNRALAQLQEIR